MSGHENRTGSKLDLKSYFRIKDGGPSPGRIPDLLLIQSQLMRTIMRPVIECPILGEFLLSPTRGYSHHRPVYLFFVDSNVSGRFRQKENRGSKDFFRDNGLYILKIII
jgi:hypothetical protein